MPGDTRIAIRFFGRPCFEFDGRPWPFRGAPRCIPLLALLVMRGEPLSRDTLAATLWPDEAHADARGNVRRHLHRLRQALPSVAGVEWLIDAGRSVAWNRDAPAFVDVTAFEAMLRVPATRAAATELYTGDVSKGTTTSD